MLADKVVVVTGAGRGMGAGIAEVVHSHGARVALIDVRDGTAEATAARLDPTGARAAGITGDVTSDADIDAVLALAVERFGTLDGWVNNAGVIAMARAIDTTQDNFDQHLRVNTFAVLRCCQAAATWWRANDKPGAIVNIASAVAKTALPQMVSYGVSKAGVVNLTRALAHEWARTGINVNCICPSGVDTPMLDAVAEYLAPGADPTRIRAGMSAGDLGRTITPTEIGGVVAFLLSDAATVIRGQAINVDGGESPY